MNQNIADNNTENAPVSPTPDKVEENTKEKAAAKMRKQMEETLRTVSKGEIRLDKPIRASGSDVTVLRYDFTKLTGWEFARALDRDTSSKTSAFRLTQMQALELFAAAAAKETPGVDEEDIRTRMSISDAVTASQIAVVFFNLTSQTASYRTTN